MGEILKQQNRLLVDFGNPLVKLFLPILLQDHTTGKNIIWATEPPENLTGMYSADDEITIEKIFEVDIKPRCLKRITDQKKRTTYNSQTGGYTYMSDNIGGGGNWDFWTTTSYGVALDKARLPPICCLF